MILDRYDPLDILALLPELGLELEPELAELDRLLEDDLLFEKVKADLSRRYPNSKRLGRHSTPVEVILRMLVIKRLYDFSYEQTERFVSDSITLRQFCRLYLEPAPDDTTLIRWANLIGADTLEELNEHVVRMAASLKVTRGRKLRTDGTVVETNVHYPTDSSLLSDGVRVLGRLARKAKNLVGKNVRKEARGAPFRDRSRSAKRLTRAIEQLARRVRSPAVRDAYRKTYGRLLGVANASITQAQRLIGLLSETWTSSPEKANVLGEDLEHSSELLSWVVSQTERRVLREEKVPAAEKLVSIFEPHTEIIRRGKAAKPTEFGKKVWLSEVEGGIISYYRILDGNPADVEQIEPELDHHLTLFGKPPILLAADRGCHSADNERLAGEVGVSKVCLPQRGKKTQKRRKHERQSWFKRAQRFRAGSEGRISVLKRGGQLGRCRDHGEEGFSRWVGWGILAANLGRIARHLAAPEQRG